VDVCGRQSVHCAFFAAKADYSGAVHNHTRPGAESLSSDANYFQPGLDAL
jgi:hypothetical protein